MKRLFALILCCLLWIPSTSHGATLYTYEELLKSYENAQVDVNKSSLDYEIKEREYNDILEGYDDLEEAVEDALDRIDIFKKHIDQLTKEAEETERTEYISLPFGMRMRKKDYLYTYTIPSYVNAYSGSIGGYETIVKRLLPNYKNMELMQHDMATLEQQEVLQEKQQRFTFSQYYFDYVAYEKEMTYLKSKLAVAEDSKKTLALSIKQGSATEGQLVEKEAEIMALELKFNDVEANRNACLQKILYSTNMTEQDIALAIEMPVLKYYAPMDKDEFSNVAIKSNLLFQTQKKTYEILEDMDILIHEVYDEDDEDGKRLLLEVEQQLGNAKSTLRQVATGVESGYDAYVSAYEKYELAIARYDLEKRQYEAKNLEKTKYSSLEQRQHESDYLGSEFNYARATADFYRQYHNYLLWLEGGTPR